MNTDDQDRSLGDAATFAGSSKRRSAHASLGDERTLGGGDAAGIDTVFDDIEVVDLAARYKTEGTLGRGGMGEVLLALDTRLDRKVAIKRILGEAARSKTAVSRFLTEAKAIAALNHPNVVQIYDYGRAADGPFLIMEYVDGSSLLDRCRDGALPLEQAVDLACQLCDGLAKAHDLGIVHRDIKPANVLLTKDGLPKLTDFGLAKAEATDHQMTMTGAVLGTPDFMPPEQRKDAALVDPRSDLWSLAASLYQMVTGRSPKIIRFDLLPPGLTSVLGKALEESKDDRYQSAREFRDALKTSLVASAPAATELGEGQCPACGVKNDSSRRFCRGCGEALEAPCLSCSKPMPMWEHICGQCGTKQAPLLEDRRGEMAARQAEAEGLLKDYDFDQAERITASLRDEPDPRLKQLVPWATEFVAKIGKAREAQLAQAGVRIAEALKHEGSFDYASAVHALEQVPEILRSRALSGHTDTVETALARVSEKKAEVSRLERFVKERITSRELSELLPHVRQLLLLRPDRTDVRKLCSQLEERQQKLVAQRDEAIKLARSHLASKDYESTIAALRTVDRSVVTPDVENIRVEAATSFKRLQALMQEISLGTKEKQLEGLIGKVEEALQLKPGHGELVKLRDALQARETKIDADIELALDKARQLANNCRFGEATLLLVRIPEGRQSALIRDHIQRFDSLARAKAAAAKAVKADADYDEACGTANLYDLLLQQNRISDPEFTAAHKTLQAARADQVRTQRWMSQLRKAATWAVVGAVVISAGLWVRGSLRARSLKAALASGRWDDALLLDSSNAEAYLRRAVARASGDRKSIEAALDDVEQATKHRADPAGLRDASARVHAAYAASLATAGEMKSAEQEFAKCEEQTAASDVVSVARAALVDGWTRQATKALDDKNPTKARECCLAAQRHGAASPEFIQAFSDSCKLLAQDALGRSNTKAAIGFLVEMGEASSATFAATMSSDTMTPLRDDVAASLQKRFKALSDERQYPRAITSLMSLSNVAPASFSTLLGELSSFPADAILALPPLQNSVGMAFKLLPAGEFMMGDEKAEGGSKTKQTVPRVFFMGVTEVTNEQYSRVMGDLPLIVRKNKRTNPQCAVDGATWDEAVAFCKKLSASQSPALPLAVRYRLPLQSEWEYACRAGSTTNFCFGTFTNEMSSGWGTPDSGGELAQYAWFDKNSPEVRNSFGDSWKVSSPVATKLANKWGLHDMHGNVWEWCSDSDKPGYYVSRGGCSISSPESCRSACKDYVERPDGKGVDTTGVNRGFRVVMQIGE